MARSAEPYKKKAYSVDLRWRVVYQRIAINLPFNDIARNLNIATSTAYRTYMLFERTGQVDPVDRSSGREELQKLDRSGELYVIGFVLVDSILIMDNCSVHHVNEVREVLQQAGILVLFLPPYSPDLNPLEEAFSYVKQYLRRHDELLQAISDPIDVIKKAFQSITVEHCNSWISHASYVL